MPDETFDCPRCGRETFNHGLCPSCEGERVADIQGE